MCTQNIIIESYHLHKNYSHLKSSLRYALIKSVFVARFLGIYNIGSVTGHPSYLLRKLK